MTTATKTTRSRAQAKIDRWMRSMPAFPPQPACDPADAFAPVTRDAFVWLTMKTALRWIEDDNRDDRFGWLAAAMDVLDESQWTILFGEEDEDGDIVVARHIESGRVAGCMWDDDEQFLVWGAAAINDSAFVVDPVQPTALFVTQIDKQLGKLLAFTPALPIDPLLPEPVRSWYGAGCDLAQQIAGRATPRDAVFEVMSPERLFVINQLFALQRAFCNDACGAAQSVAYHLGFWFEEGEDLGGAFWVFDPRKRQAACAWFEGISVGFDDQVCKDLFVRRLQDIGRLPQDEDDDAFHATASQRRAPRRRGR